MKWYCRAADAPPYDLTPNNPWDSRQGVNNDKNVNLNLQISRWTDPFLPEARDNSDLWEYGYFVRSVLEADILETAYNQQNYRAFESGGPGPPWVLDSSGQISPA